LEIARLCEDGDLERDLLERERLNGKTRKDVACDKVIVEHINPLRPARDIPRSI